MNQWAFILHAARVARAVNIDPKRAEEAAAFLRRIAG
jgi:hypothetical protein